MNVCIRWMTRAISLDLVRMPVVAVCDGDSIEVSTRIGLMEKGINELKDTLGKLIKNNAADIGDRASPIHVVGDEAVATGLVAGEGHGHLVNGRNQQQPPWSVVVAGPQAQQARGRQQQRYGGVSTQNSFETLRVPSNLHSR